MTECTLGVFFLPAALVSFFLSVFQCRHYYTLVHRQHLLHTAVMAANVFQGHLP